MNQTIVCTVGTSLAKPQECRSLSGFLQRATAWDEDTTALTREIETRIARYDLQKPQSLIELSAELNSLCRLGITRDDRVILLATDTAEGNACATMLARCIRNAFGLSEDAVRVERIEGLQVRDTARLRTVGLVRLLDRVLAYVSDPQIRYGSEIILNATGGYKGVVPFLTVIGMLFRLRSVYIFEFADSLITLPPLPCSFDLHLYQRALPALTAIDRESSIAEEAYFQKIIGFEEYERDLFSGFIEPAGPGVVTLSPLAFALQRIEQSGTRTLYLSPAIAKNYENTTGLSRAAIDRGLANLANPLWRSIHVHSFPSTDLIVFKWDRTTLRMATILKSDYVYVCELYTSHDEYERALPGKKVAQYALAQFILWEPPPEEDAETPFLQALERENADLKARVRELENARSDNSGTLRDTLTKKIEMQIRAEYKEELRAKSKLETELSRSREELARLKKMIGGRG